jgi:Leucine-rich repeat (LRR) protein
LGLGENQISNLMPLVKMAELTELYLYNNRIVDSAPLMGLTNLKELNLKSNLIPLAQKGTLEEALPNCYTIF